MAARANHARPLVVWCFVDGLRGHENQTDGLISALSDRTPLSIHTVPTPRTRRVKALWRALLEADTRTLPNPNLLIGTGNATHLPMLVARRRRGGRAVVLMKPSFPMAWFDLVIAPAHDRLTPRENLLVTRGALNRMSPAQEKHSGEGLILIGGPERAHPWAPDMLEAQITAIADCHWDIQWCAASSRRTPTDFLPHLRKLKLANLDTVAVVDAVRPQSTIGVSVSHLRFAFSGIFILHVLSTPEAHRRFPTLCAWLLLFWVVDGMVQAAVGRDLFGFAVPAAGRINALFGDQGLV